jgi:hypothetical protein
MSARLVRVSFLGVALLMPVSAHAAEACFPACRAGFLCSPEGKCVSECNPRCADGESCKAGACITKDERAKEVRAAKDEEETTRERRFAFFGGPSVVFASYYFEPAALPAFQMAFDARIPVGAPKTGALVVGVRGNIGYVSDAKRVLGIVGLDLGYQLNLAEGTISHGPLVFLQPKVWAGGGTKGALDLGGALGWWVRWRALELQLPIGLSYVTDLGSSVKDFFALSISGLVGVAF